MIRVTGGLYRGNLLYCPRDIRPSSGRIKEYIFSQIGQYTIGANVLDLFAGSGALGIEALSRKASDVTFVDISRHSVNAIKKNLSKLMTEGRIQQMDALKYIATFEARPFDLIFVDPPYEEFIPDNLIKAIVEAEMLNEGGHLIFEMMSKIPQPEAESLLLSSYRTLGDTTVGIWFRPG
jgi:16S rRNA (guanine966-N2)-methyltransferase